MVNCMECIHIDVCIKAATSHIDHCNDYSFAGNTVEVVRCRDCKYSTLPSLVTQRYGVPGAMTCHNHKSPCNKRNVNGECFCPYGERKDGGNDG